MISYEKLRNLMAERGISGRKLAIMAGISKNTTTKFNKNLPVDLSVLIKVSAALGCKIDDILDY